MKRRQFLSQAAGATAAAMGTAFANRSSAKAEGLNLSRLRVGQSVALSGMAAGIGIELQRGWLAAFQQVNRSGGVYDRELELISLDDAYDPPRTMANTRELISRGVFVLGGYQGTPTTVAALPAIKDADMPLIAPFSGSGLLRSASLPQIFNVRASYMQEGVPIVKHLMRYGGDTPRIGLFVQDDLYGQSVEASILSALKARELAPIAIARIPRGSADVRSAAKLLLERGASAVAMGSTYEPSAELVKALRQAGSTAVTASVSFVGTSSLTRRLQADAHVGVCQVMPFPMSGTMKVTRDYHLAMAAAGFADYSYESVEGYVGAMTLIDGLRRCGPYPTRAALMAGLETNLDLGGFYLRFKRGDHEGSSFTELVDVGPNGQLLR